MIALLLLQLLPVVVKLTFLSFDSLALRHDFQPGDFDLVPDLVYVGLGLAESRVDHNPDALLIRHG